MAAATAGQLLLLAEDKQITVRCLAEASVWVEGDRARIKQVVVNLLDNAIKYTQAGDWVELRVQAQGRHAVMEVSDNGPGIPAESLPHVFERFYRVDKARSRALGGAGLGLSIVKSICASHGGRVEASSANGVRAPPLLRLSQLDRLRCAFPVSMDYAPLINSGTRVTIETRNQPNSMEGVVSRIARRIETATRTMDVEVDIDNPGLRLIPGVYASATLHLERKQGALSLPLEAVGRGKSPTVFAITDRRLIEERPVTLGLTTPADVEILSGIKEGDLVLTASRGRVAVGQSVEPRVAAIP